MKSLKKRKVWDLVFLPKGRKPIIGRWVFIKKSDSRTKAHFIAKGFTQVFSIDYEETFSPVARFETLHLIISLTTLHNWELEALNVKTAFLYDKLDKEIYMQQPECYVIKNKETYVYRLQKSIYELKQAALKWDKQLHASLLKMGFQCTSADPETYVKIIGQDIIILLVYVDEALFTGNNKQLVLSHEKQFMQQWESHDLEEAKEYLGTHITRDQKKKTIILDQCAYAQKVVKHFRLEKSKGKDIPLPTGYNPNAYEGECDPSLHTRYQFMIGSLLYIMLGTQPDLAYLVIKMSQFSTNPSEDHLQ